MPRVSDPLVVYALRFGDSALVHAQRTSEWVARAPIMEEDVALANVALDLFGQARMWLSYAGEVEGAGRDEDRLAFHRDASEFFNVLLVERRSENFAETIAQGYFYALWSYLALEKLVHSNDARIAAIAAKSRKEVAYRVRRGEDWVTRLGDGTELSRARMQAAVDDAWAYTGEVFIADQVDDEMVRRGVGFDPAALRAPWEERVRTVLTAATLRVPDDRWMHRGSKEGTHTEALGYLLAEMQVLPRSMPEAAW